MAEVRTIPVPAVFVEYADFFDEDMMARRPGSLCIAPDTHQEAGKPWTRWLYACPCGCGASGTVRVQAGAKPVDSPSWNWNGSYDAAVLSPSVYHVGHWHGWLGGSGGQSPGIWESV